MTDTKKTGAAAAAIDLSALLRTPPYHFLSTNPHLGNRIILLTLGGSHAYGTNTEASDVDVRGCALNSPEEVLGLEHFEQFIDKATDTTIYGFNRFIQLLVACNPNVVEILGGKPEHRIANKLGQMLVDNRKLFLSQRAIDSFGGYATQTLRRLQCAYVGSDMPQSDYEAYLKSAMERAIVGFTNRYPAFKEEQIRLFLTTDVDDDEKVELLTDFNMQGVPVRQFKSMLECLIDVNKNAEKLGQRNRKKDPARLAKHGMHLIRLYLEGLDVLEKGDIITWRGDDLGLLMSIRRGEFQNEDGTFRPDFFEMVGDFERQMAYAKENTSLPPSPDAKKVTELMMEINKEALNV